MVYYLIDKHILLNIKLIMTYNILFRHGARYWFASRRIWVSSEGEVDDASGESVEPKYYSTRAQLIELIETIDKEKYEKELYEGILDIQVRFYTNPFI
jgi:hypothetical protein